MRAFSSGLGRPIQDGSGGGHGVALGDIAAFQQAPGPDYLLADGRNVRQSEYPDLVGKLPATGQSDNVGRGALAKSLVDDGNGSTLLYYRKMAVGFGQAMIFPGYDCEGVPLLSTDDGQSFGADRELGNRLGSTSPVIAAYMYDASRVLILNSNRSNYIYYSVFNRSNNVMSGVDSLPVDTSASGYRSGVIDYNPLTKNYIVSFESKIYRAKDPVNGPFTLVGTNPQFQAARHMLFAPDGTGVMLGRYGGVIATKDDFDSVVRFSVSETGKALSYSNGTYMFMTDGGRVYRTKTPMVSASWQLVLNASQNVGGMYGENGVWQIPIWDNGQGVAGFYESVDDGLTWNYRYDNRYTRHGYVIGRVPSGWLKIGEDANYYWNQRYQPYPSVQIPSAQQSRPDGKRNYMRAR